MRDLVILAEKQFSYTKRLLLRRKERFTESFSDSLFQGESTAGEVFIHGIEPLFHFCYKILGSNTDESSTKIELDHDMNFPEHYIELYEKTLELLKILQLKLTEDDLNKPILFSSSSNSKKPLRELLCLNIMHTITHIGQALRLQALYLRNKT
ncbi:MAG: hypothetical protein ACFFAU_04205 [Candidatus Hodarchaeota archaeon]